MDYKDKVISVEQALDKVKTGDYIVTGLGAAEGGDFMSRIHTIAHRVKDVVISNCLPSHPSQIYDPQYAESLGMESWFYTPDIRRAHANGNMSYIPNHLHLAAYKRLFFRTPNIYVGAATMPDKHGFISLSMSNTYEKRFMDKADLIILEINPNMPYTFGDVEVRIEDVDYLIESNYAVPEMPDAPSSDKDRVIGKLIADQVPDGACIQLGIGGIPNAVAAFLEEKNDLGVHTEMITTNMMRLAKKGVITGKRKQINKGKMVATFAMGTRELYDYMDWNPSIAIFDGHWVNDPYVIAQNDNQVSINTTLEVDLTGQCASESLGSTQFSGTGGQADTAIGAQMSKNGKSIIALYATAMVRQPDGTKKEVSKITPQLMTGAAVTLSRNDVDLVVTEYGVAHLRGTSIRDRVARLIEIAHPDFRDFLWDEALRLKLVTKRP